MTICGCWACGSLMDSNWSKAKGFGGYGCSKYCQEEHDNYFSEMKTAEELFLTIDDEMLELIKEESEPFHLVYRSTKKQLDMANKAIGLGVAEWGTWCTKEKKYLHLTGIGRHIGEFARYPNYHKALFEKRKKAT